LKAPAATIRPLERSQATRLMYCMWNQASQLEMSIQQGVTRLDSARGKIKFGAPMFQPDVLRKQMYWIKCLWHCWDFSAPL